MRTPTIYLTRVPFVNLVKSVSSINLLIWDAHGQYVQYGHLLPLTPHLQVQEVKKTVRLVHLHVSEMLEGL